MVNALDLRVRCPQANLRMTPPPPPRARCTRATWSTLRGTMTTTRVRWCPSPRWATQTSSPTGSSRLGRLYKDRSSRKTDTQLEKRSSRRTILLKIVSENWFSRKAYFYTIGSRQVGGCGARGAAQDGTEDAPQGDARKDQGPGVRPHQK